MRIAHVTGSISRVGAGVSKVVRDLAEAQTSNGDTIHIFTLLDYFTHIDQPNQKDITVSAFPVTLSPRFGYSRSLQKALSEHAGSVDIIHMHGLWMYPNWAAGNVARKSATPYIISPHGMLDFRSLRLKKWKKQIARFAYEDKNFKYAACLHACSEMEADHIRNFGYTGPIAIIPSGVALSELQHPPSITPSKKISFQNCPPLSNKKIILYLSRLHEQKGLHFLLEAWQSIYRNFPDWYLVIAGDGEPAYVADLQKKVRETGLADSVTLKGPVHGDDKWDLMKKADIFVLPSYSENFGLVVAEALACGVPVITTKGVPWADLETEDCGWWIDVGAKPLKECLIHALGLSKGKLSSLGRNGRKLVESKYTITSSANKMDETYKWIIMGGSPPECISLT